MDTPSTSNDYKKKILLVEDSPSDKFFLLNVFKKIVPDAQITTYPKAADALTALQGGYLPDIIFADNTMPLMDGVDFITAARKVSTLATTPMILLSGSMSPDLEKRATDSGANGFCEKPLDMNQIESCLRQFLLK
jgi:CheY-like chemotaxis protein